MTRKITASVSPNNMPQMITRSSRKAPARSPTLPRCKPRSTPSGVTNSRTSLFATGMRRLAIGRLAHRHHIEIEEPAEQSDAADRGARGIVLHHLPADAFEYSGDPQHHHHAEHRDRRGAACRD